MKKALTFNQLFKTPKADHYDNYISYQELNNLQFWSKENMVREECFY